MTTSLRGDDVISDRSDVIKIPFTDKEGHCSVHWRRAVAIVLRTPQNRRGCTISWHSNALIQEVDNPQCGLTPAPKGTPTDIRMNLIFSVTRFIGLQICAVGSKRRIYAATECWPKRILTSNSRSRSFKFIHFAISYWPTRGSMSPYNIAGLISEDSEEVTTQIAKNCRRR